jgi:multidrug efflux pump subunit AcrB
MKRVQGVVDIDNGLVAAGSSLVFMPDVDRLSQFGITLKDFQEQLAAYTGGVPLCQNENVLEPLPSQAAMTGGLQIGSVQDGEQMRRILMRFTNYSENSPEKLMRQQIFLPDGTTRPLSFFCTVKVVPGEIQQRRENLKSVIALTSRIENRDLGSTVRDIQHQFDTHLHLPKGYSVSFGGAYQEQQQSFHELMMILCLATLLVMCVLMFLFREWRISFAVLFISVTGICGSLLALWLTGVPLNVSSYTGIIMIVGIIAENAIFTVHQYNMNRRAGGGTAESVNYAIALRIRPKLMTAISSILALMPLALGLEAGTQMQQPLAVAVIGGFCVALPLLLVVLPSLMMVIYKNRK